MIQRSPSEKAIATASDACPVFTIGHSRRTIAEFVTLLRAGQVQLVVDIRRFPRSRTNPQYNADALPAELAGYQIDYIRIAELGGLRKSSDVAPETNGFWTNQSFHHYADYALADDFQRGLACLLNLSATQRTAIMCAEAVWWRCHRRIVADYLINAGRTVYHLMDTNEVHVATLTKGAVRAGDRLIYPASG
ncbi:DUF488 family protein [Bradyrhizobium sp. HKCCYLS1011]|uniref:DUF488 domain-containing protein n=1 Tax=Bradyrhizobium sp. HKCCYLS1011 TaxID=3420733 RepID=UPI003EBB7907